jgi:hypothetical protein
MRTSASPGRRAACGARWLAAAALGTLAMLGTATAAQAQPAIPAAGARAAAAPLPKPQPIALNLLNWSGSAGFGSRPPAWYIDKYGIVHLQGAVTQTSSSGSGANTIGTLPPAARPSHDVYTIVHTFNGTYADLVIQTSGAIDLINPRPPMVQDYTFVSLESISYRR